MNELKRDLAVVDKALHGTFRGIATVEDKAKAFDRLMTVLDHCIGYEMRTLESLEDPESVTRRMGPEVSCCDIKAKHRGLEALVRISDAADAILGFAATDMDEKADREKMADIFTKYCHAKNTREQKLLSALFLQYLGAYQTGEIRLPQLRPDLAKKIFERIFRESEDDFDD